MISPDTPEPPDEEVSARVKKYVAALVKKYDKNEDGVLTKEELSEEMAKNAAAIDLDKDNKITPAEMAKYLVKKK